MGKCSLAKTNVTCYYNLTENKAYAKFWGDKQRALWYVMVFSGAVN